MLGVLLFIILKSSLVIGELGSELKWDPNGYIMYCPCMGRFGNQAEQFLGALSFAKGLNRTMILPPWVAYDHTAGTSFTPYNYWFDVTELQKYHRAILMHDFMEHLAPEHWPDDGKSRKVYCHAHAAQRSQDLKSCPAKTGNPFGPFWDNFIINFSGGSELYPAGALSSYNPHLWTATYPPSKHPVLAFMGAPGHFPVEERDRGLQKYVKWSDKISTLANDFIASKIKQPYIGIHLRNGIDWVRACDHVKDVTDNFMASAQCLGYGKKHKLTKDICLPPKEKIVEKVTEIAKLHNIEHLFIATDYDDMMTEFSKTSLKVVKYHEDYPIMDLALLTFADVFIGNCVSSFSSFVVRDREIKGKPNYFFAFDQPHAKIIHKEL